MEKEVLIKFAEQMLVWLQDAKAFANSEIPQLMQEVVRFGVISRGLGIASGFGIMFAAYRGHKAIQKRLSDEKYSDAPMFYFLVIPTAIIALFIISGNIEEFIMAAFSPRLYLIEYFKAFIR